VSDSPGSGQRAAPIHHQDDVPLFTAEGVETSEVTGGEVDTAEVRAESVTLGEHVLLPTGETATVTEVEEDPFDEEVMAITFDLHGQPEVLSILADDYLKGLLSREDHQGALCVAERGLKGRSGPRPHADRGDCCCEAHTGDGDHFTALAVTHHFLEGEVLSRHWIRPGSLERAHPTRCDVDTTSAAAPVGGLLDHSFIVGPATA
jgi:hypothetical protein